MMAFPVTPSTPPPTMGAAFFWTEEEAEEPVQQVMRPLDQYFEDLAAAGLHGGEYLRERGWFMRDPALQARLRDLCVVLDMGPQINVAAGDFREHLDEITMAYLTRITDRYPVPAAGDSGDDDTLSTISEEEGEEVVWWSSQGNTGDI